MKNFKRPVALFLAVAFTALFASPVFASKRYTEDTGKPCGYCHEGTPEELVFTDEGEQFIANHYQMPMGGMMWQRFSQKFERFIMSLHAVAAFALAGGFIYMSFVFPRLVESRPFSDRERFLFRLAAALSPITGVAMIPLIAQADNFWVSTVGFILIGKITFYVILAGIIFYMLYVLGPKADRYRAGETEEDKKKLKEVGDTFFLLARTGMVVSILMIAITALWEI